MTRTQLEVKVQFYSKNLRFTLLLYKRILINYIIRQTGSFQ